MHHTRASARGATNRMGKGGLNTQGKKSSIKSTRSKIRQKKLKLITTQNRTMSMNVWDDTSKAEINTYSQLEGDVIVASTQHSQSFLHLNRPKALNALNLRMVRDITSHLRKWETNPNSLGVIMSGVGGKAFCAGGDIMSLYNSGKRWNERGDESGYNSMATFFREEYQLNWNISRMVTPFVAFMNGITMGGGVGLAMHAQHRIATEKTLFAMPETGIGFFPDVGASHILSKLPHSIGMYLGLTGARLKAADLVHLGLASAFMFSESYGHLYDELVDDHHHHSNTDRVIHSNAYDTDELPKLSLTPHLECISRCFSQPTVEQIIEALEAEQVDKEFAAKTIATLQKMAPLSLKVTHEQLTRGRKMDLDECLIMEYDIARNMIENPDFYTGVKSVLIDKTTRGARPNWQHKDIKSVPTALVAKYFETPHNLGKLDVRAKEPVKGSGWESIQRITFEEENSRTAGPSSYQYPMFRPLPQQLHPVEATSGHEYGAARDIFHLMYWNYLFKHTSTRFPLTQDPAATQIKMLSAHSLQLEKDEFDGLADKITSIDQFIDVDADYALSNSPNAANHTAFEIASFPHHLYKTRQALLQAKKYINITTHPEEKEIYQSIIDQHTPKDAEAKAMFGILNDKVDQLAVKYPMAAFVMHKMRQVTHPTPLLLENFDIKNPNEGRETFFAEEIMFKYPTEQIVAIKQQIKAHYTELCQLLNVPVESAPAMMMAEFGSKNTDILGVFGENWKEELDKINPATGLEYGDLWSQFHESLEKMSFDDAKAHASQLGIDLNPQTLFPQDKTRQKIYSMFMDTVELRTRHGNLNQDAFQIDKVQDRLSKITAGEVVDPNFDPNAAIDVTMEYKYLPNAPKYTSPHDDDVNVKGVFSDGEIDEAENATFLRTARRSKLELIFQSEVAQLEKLGATLTPIDGGVLVENFNGTMEDLKKFTIGKDSIKVNVATNNSQLPAPLRPKVGAYIVSIAGGQDEQGDQLLNTATKRLHDIIDGKVVETIDVDNLGPNDEDPIFKELATKDDPNAPVASGGHYHGATDVLRKLTLTRQKLHLTEQQVAKLETKHAIFIPSTAANLESNASILQRLLESRIPLPFDRSVNENKIITFAQTLQEHFDPAAQKDPNKKTDLHKERDHARAVAEAIQFITTELHNEPARIIDTGEILPGEEIPASIQKHMKPYEARVASLPSPQMFHTSAALTTLTNAFHHVLTPGDKGQAIAKIKSYSHLNSIDEFKNKQIEYTTAKKMYIEELASPGNDITRPPESQNDPNFTELVTSPHPEFHDFITQSDPVSPFMPVSPEERLARNFLNFIRVPDFAIDAVYPSFNYFLEDSSRHPGKNLQLNFEGANPYSDNPDAFKINYGDISRPMLPPKLAKTLNAHFATIKAHEEHKGNQKV